MRPRLLALLSVGCCVSLSGCDLLRLMLPHKPTTAAEARRAMQRCGISPDRVRWRVLNDGSFVFGSAVSGSPPISDRQSDCLMHWAEDNRVEVGIIGREVNAT